MQYKIVLENVNLKIPILAQSNNSIKHKILSFLSGGRISTTNNLKKSVEALSSISCTLNEGERIALIGHNGAGKSSFIRLISGIYQATSGIIKSNVDVYPMIDRSFIVEEDLTGLEAAKAHYLIINNSLEGFNHFLDYIINFSEIGEFLYLPLKTYSEGMASRLTFSLLTYLGGQNNLPV